MKKIEIVDGITTGNSFALDIDNNFNELVALTGNTSSGIVDITYADLVTLIQTSALIENTSYRITDFQTRHYIVVNYIRYFGLGNEISGNLEPLIVLATSSNTIDKEAKSALYPQDIIYYDWNPENWYNDLSFGDAENTSSVIISGYTGTIYFRHDTLLDNYMGYDFRNCKFRRWETLTDEWNSASGYTENFNVNYNGYIYKSTALTGNTNQQPDVSPNFWIQLLNLSLTTYWNNSPYSTNGITSSSVYADFFTFTEGIGTATYPLSCINNHFDSFKETKTLGYINGTILLNTVFFLQDGGLATVSGNHIKSYFGNNTIASTFSTNTIANNFYSNNIGNNFYSNNIGNSFNSNIIGDDFSNNTIGDNFYSNTIGNGFNSNNIGNNFYNNTIGDNFYNNTIGINFQINNIGTYYYTNTIGNDFSSNQIADGFYDNTIGNSFVASYTRNGFYSNIIGNHNSQNNYDTYFAFNTIGNYFINNVLTAGFIYNNFDSGIAGFNNVNLGLTEPTGSFTKKYFANQAGVPCLSYFDITNTLIIKTLDGAWFND